MTATAKRIIKKYPNRRLYDTQLSSYITLEDIKALVLNHIPFVVTDTRTQEDLTNLTLLQIIMEMEQQGAPIFTTTVLQQFICFYGNHFQKNISDFLEKSLLFFKGQPMHQAMQNLSAQQLQTWQHLQQQWQQFFSGK